MRHAPIRQTVGLIAALVCVLAVAPCVHAEDDDADDADTQTDLFLTLRLPLEDGRLHMGRLLAALCARMDIDAEALAEHVTAGVRVDGVAGRVTMATIERATRGVIVFEIEEADGKQTMAIHIDRAALRRQKQFIRARIVRLIEAWYPEVAARAKAHYGLWVCGAERLRNRFEMDAAIAGHAVVLIHGLDEPGDVFNTLAARLVQKGYPTIEFRYPNDQRIGKSARNFARHLMVLRQAGVRRITIVAHSMGGLVSREVLTHEDYYAGVGDGGGVYPAVTRLVMAGTPNHGSPLAHLRGFTEARETLIRLFSRDRLLFGGFFDGAGEAADDLLPQSDFLTRLNARPHPQGVAMTILAGRASPVTAARIAELNARLKENVKDLHEPALDKIAASLAKVIDGVGDGAVSLASTRLEGIDDHVLVRGNHANMLDRTEADKLGVPAAINVILERLTADSKATE